MNIQAKKILLTGGTGFLGSALARMISREGLKPIITRRADSKMELIQEVARDEIVMDLRNLRPLIIVCLETLKM